MFLTIALFAHGYASIMANNALAYDEDTVAAHLERAYRGALPAARRRPKARQRKRYAQSARYLDPAPEKIHNETYGKRDRKMKQYVCALQKQADEAR